MVVHVPFGSRRNQPENRISAVVRVGNHLPMPVVSEQTPVLTSRIEAAVLHQFDGRTVRILNHAHIVDQDFSCIE